jgi:two-component system, NarL family, response regulator DesR
MRGCPQLEVVATVGTAEEALALDLSHVDAAVVEQVLGPWSITGWDVALEFRRRKRVGVVFFTNHRIPDIGGLLQADQHQGWSVVHKAMDVEAEYFAQVIQSTARGLNIMDPASQRRQRTQASGVLSRLTERQRRIMNLASSGRDGKAIAQELGLAPVTVRQELSRIYGLLVPDSAPGYDLRTTAVVRYLRELQGSGASSEAPVPVSSAG